MDIRSRYGGEQALGAQKGGGWEGQSIPAEAPVPSPQQAEQQHLRGQGTMPCTPALEGVQPPLLAMSSQSLHPSSHTTFNVWDGEVSPCSSLQQGYRKAAGAT